jgi:phenylacetate-CoA ligase
MIPCPLSRLWWRRYIRRGADSWQELEDFPQQTPAEQQKVLARRLLDQIHYFGRREDALPEWREAAAIQDPAELWRIWPSMPVMRKSHLQKQFNAAEIGSRFGIPGKVNSSGGSTGEPVSFFHDMGMLRKSMAASLYIHQRMGWTPGMPTLIVWGSDRDIRKATTWQNRVHATLRNEHLLAGYTMTAELIDSVLALARRNHPVCIYGFTSMLEFVARGVLERNAALPPGYVRSAWNGGEMLFPEQSEAFRKAFGVPIFNRYGGRELSAMACQFKDGGPLHVLRPWIFVEVVDDQGRAVSPGESGRLLMTSTVNRGTPFLRYEIGDLGTYAAAHSTEAGITALDSLQGRVSGLLRLANGKVIQNTFWNHLFKEFSEVRQFQVVLAADGNLAVLLKGNGFAPERETHLLGTLRSMVGDDIAVSMRWVEEIPRTAQGKLIQVVRETSASPN